MTLPSVTLPSLPDLGEFSAFKLLQREREKIENRARASRMSFFKDAVKVRGSVLPRIFPSLVGITLFAGAIALADLKYGFTWRISSQTIAPLTLVVGLLIVFRNSSSYERWWAGITAWQQTTSDVRSLSRLIWTNVDVEAEPRLAPPPLSSATTAGARSQRFSTASMLSQDEDEEREASRPTNVIPPQETPQERVARRIERKKRTIRLLVAFLVACKHHLRGEHGVHYADYRGIVPEELLQELGSSGSRGLLRSRRRTVRAAQEAGLLDGLNKRGVDTDAIRRDATDATQPEGTPSLDASDEREPLLLRRRSRASVLATGASTDVALLVEDLKLMDEDERPPVPLPMTILFEVDRYISGVRRSGMIEDLGPAGFTMFHNLVHSLTGRFSDLERISSTTIPFKYSVHLKQTTLLYLLALPLTLIQELGWRMVPFVTLVAMALLGLEGIASEIEEPFGYDISDHPLDLLSSSLRHEIEHMFLSLPDSFDAE